MIAEFKEETASVAAQVRDATRNFREIDRLDAVIPLPASVTASVTSLALHARDFRAKLGYEIAFHECRVETETVDALTVVDSVDRDFAGENAPSARVTLLSFLKRYPEPPGDNQKPLWRYFSSALSLCERLKNEAETHLQRAQSLASAGKTSEALREYQEIYRVYPNPVTAEKIRQLQGQPR
jgi:ADP-ribose pyrophosphatase YjhB (NUDIX family)